MLKEYGRGAGSTADKHYAYGHALVGGHVHGERRNLRETRETVHVCVRQGRTAATPTWGVSSDQAQAAKRTVQSVRFDFGLNRQRGGRELVPKRNNALM